MLIILPTKLFVAEQISASGNLNIAYVTMADNRPNAPLTCYITNRISSISVGGSSVTMTVSDPGTGIVLYLEFLLFTSYNKKKYLSSFYELLKYFLKKRSSNFVTFLTTEVVKILTLSKRTSSAALWARFLPAQLAVDASVDGLITVVDNV